MHQSFRIGFEKIGFIWADPKLYLAAKATKKRLLNPNSTTALNEPVLRGSDILRIPPTTLGELADAKSHVKAMRRQKELLGKRDAKNSAIDDRRILKKIHPKGTGAPKWNKKDEDLGN